MAQYSAVINGKQVYSDKPIVASNPSFSIGTDTPSGVYIPASANYGQAAYVEGATQQLGSNGQVQIIMPNTVHSAPVEPVSTYVPPSQYAAYPWAAQAGYVPPAQQPQPTTNYNAGSAVVPTAQQSQPVQGATPTTTTSSNDILPSTGGIGGMIDKVAPVFVLLILVKIVSGVAGLVSPK